MAKSKSKRKPEILTAKSYHNGKIASVVRFEYRDHKLWPIEEEQFTEGDEQREFQEKVCRNIGRTASELPSFQ